MRYMLRTWPDCASVAPTSPPAVRPCCSCPNTVTICSASPVTCGSALSAPCRRRRGWPACPTRGAVAVASLPRGPGAAARVLRRRTCWRAGPGASLTHPAQALGEALHGRGLDHDKGAGGGSNFLRHAGVTLQQAVHCESGGRHAQAVRQRGAEREGVDGPPPRLTKGRAFAAPCWCTARAGGRDSGRGLSHLVRKAARS